MVAGPSDSRLDEAAWWTGLVAGAHAKENHLANSATGRTLLIALSEDERTETVAEMTDDMTERPAVPLSVLISLLNTLAMHAVRPLLPLIALAPGGVFPGKHRHRHLTTDPRPRHPCHRHAHRRRLATAALATAALATASLTTAALATATATAGSSDIATHPSRRRSTPTT